MGRVTLAAATAGAFCATGVSMLLLSTASLGKPAGAGCDGASDCPYRNVQVIGAFDPLALGVVTALTFDAQGDLYAADSRTSQIVEFGADGRLRRRLLRFGTGRQQLAAPTGVAMLADGSLVAADLDWVKRFSSAGHLLRAWRVRGVHDVSVDQADRIWTTDGAAVRRFTAAGKPLGAWHVGDRPESPAYPSAVAAGAGRVLVRASAIQIDSDVIVHSGSRQGIYALTLDGTSAFSSVCPLASPHPSDSASCSGGPIAAARDGSFWLATEKPVLAHIDADGRQIGSLPVLNPTPEYEGATALAVAPDGRIAVADQDHLIRIYSVGRAGPQQTLGHSAPAPSILRDPQAVAVAGDRSMYVFDNGDSSIKQFTPSGRFRRAWKTPIYKDPYQDGALGLGVTGRGNVVVADHQLISVYSSTGILRDRFRVPHGLVRIAVSGGRIYVAEDVYTTPVPHSLDEAIHGGGIRVYTIGGKLLRRLRLPRAAPAARDLTDMAIGNDGRIYLTDARRILPPVGDGNDRLEIFSASGKLLRQIPMATPQAVAVGSDGSLFVASDVSQREGYEYLPARARSYITALTPSLRGAYSFGDTGSRPGEFHNPSSIALDSVAGRIVLVVVDRGNHRIQRFTLAQPKR